jgi:hypothetical protein
MILAVPEDQGIGPLLIKSNINHTEFLNNKNIITILLSCGVKEMIIKSI